DPGMASVVTWQEVQPELDLPNCKKKRQWQKNKKKKKEGRLLGDEECGRALLQMSHPDPGNREEGLSKTLGFQVSVFWETMEVAAQHNA
ncbi:hypothetical protein JD844_013607, partial [Phrynosoma platyrhinos]